MARKSRINRNYIKLGWIGLGVLILFGIVANIDQTFVPGFDAVPFNVPIPLDVLSALEITATVCRDGELPNANGVCVAANSLIECRIWTEGIIGIAGLAGTATIETQAPFVTQLFDPDISGLIILDVRGDEVEFIELDIRMRCDPKDFSGISSVAGGGGVVEGTTTPVSFTLTGGTIESRWIAKDGNGITKSVTDSGGLVAKIGQLPTGNILFDPNSPGVLLQTTKITGESLDNSLTSTQEVYFTQPQLIITVKPDFNFKIPSPFFIDDDSTAVTVVLNSGVPQVKVFNQVLDAPTPTNNQVKISSIETQPSELNDDETTPAIKVKVQLPNWNEAEGSPTMTVSRPTDSGSKKVVAKDIPITGKKLVDASTNTYEFFISSFILEADPLTSVFPKLVAGQWVVEANHPARSGTDAQFFNVYSTESQPDPNKKAKEGGTQEPCQVDCGPPPDPDGAMIEFLNIGELLECFERTDATACLNDSKFFTLYAILGGIMLLSIVTGRRS